MQIQRCNSIGCNLRSNSAQSVNFKGVVIEGENIPSRVLYEAIDKATLIVDKTLGGTDSVLHVGPKSISLRLSDHPYAPTISKPINCSGEGLDKNLITASKKAAEQLVEYLA